MPPLVRLQLKDIAKRFNYDDTFTFVSSTGTLMTWRCEKEFNYHIHFHINEFSELSQPCGIDQIVSAIDESKYFELEITF
jgi:hypothetical protein